MYPNSSTNNIFYTFLNRELKNIFKNDCSEKIVEEVNYDDIEIPTLSQEYIVEEQPNNKDIPCTYYDYKNKSSDVFIVNKPKSSFGEAIKSIRTNLQFSNINRDKKVILVTSPQPSDGKSTISSNLAVAYAQDDKKVLIIDSDLRRGRQSGIFGIYPTKHFGYTNMILNYDGSTDNFKDYIIKTNVDNVYLIPNGPTPPNPIELLDSKRNRELLEKLKELFDIIILDTPPVLGLSDTLIMTKYSDANLVVVTKGKTKVEYLSEVKKSFLKANADITGVIVNKTEQKKSSYYGYYGEH